jgi:CHAD domain-containing protein
MRARVQVIAGSSPLASAAEVRRRLNHLYGDNARAYGRQLGACRRRLSRHSIHELRIAIRHLLVCLRLLGVAQGEPPGVRALLEGQLKALGAVRDVQVQLQLVKKGAPRSDRLLEPLRDHLRRRKRRRASAARLALKSDKALRRLQGWRPRLEEAGTRIVPRLRRSVDASLREAIDSLSSFSSDQPVDSSARHRTRVLSRESLHIVEALRPCWRGGRTDVLLSSLRAFQQGVGQIHDRELLLRRMGRLVASRRLGAGAVGPLRAALRAEKAERLRSCSSRQWRRVLENLLARGRLGPGGAEASFAAAAAAKGGRGLLWTASLPK